MLRNRNRRHTKAFTLLELLVSMTIMAVITASLYSTLSLAFMVKEKVQQAVTPLARMNVVFDAIRADLICAVDPAMGLGGAFLGEKAARLDNDVMTFYTSNYTAEEDEVASDVCIVEYGLEQFDTWQGYALVKRKSTNVMSPEAEVAEDDQEVLCRGIYSFWIEYYDGSDWQIEWDSENSASPLPLMVKITVQMDSQVSIDKIDEDKVKTVELVGQFFVPQPLEEEGEGGEGGGGDEN